MTKGFWRVTFWSCLGAFVVLLAFTAIVIFNSHSPKFPLELRLVPEANEVKMGVDLGGHVDLYNASGLPILIDYRMDPLEHLNIIVFDDDGHEVPTELYGKIWSVWNRGQLQLAPG